MTNNELFSYMELISHPTRFKFIQAAVHRGFFTTDLPVYEESKAAWFHLSKLREHNLFVSDDEEGSGPVRISWHVNEGLLREILNEITTRFLCEQINF